jgi:ribosome-associated heat shock protein Hsp15
MRLDRWLWCARFYKTRILAAEAIKAGHVKLNGQRCKPAKEIACDAVLSVTKGEETWVVTVAGLPGRRGPAAEAQACFVEDPEALAVRLTLRAQRRAAVMQPPTDSKPDKRTRRMIRAQRGRL